MNLTDHSSHENISNPPSTSNPSDSVEEEDVEEESIGGRPNLMTISSKIATAERANDVLEAEYQPLKKQIEILSSKLRLLKERNQFLKENILLTRHIRGFFKPCKVLLELKWLNQQLEVLRTITDTQDAITRLQDQAIANVTERNTILENVVALRGDSSALQPSHRNGT